MPRDEELDRETVPTPCSGPFDLVPGKMVNASVRLLAPLGEGGMGCVWIAEHLTLQTNVAVKFMTRALAHENESVERFAREAASAARVKSPHVVQMLDHGVTSHGVPYIVMELLEGRDLARVLAERGPLAPHLVVDIVTQCARALGRAHRRGIVHRDIKPENIFLCDLGDPENQAPFVKILDFGIAKTTMEHVGSHTRTGVLLGSPRYMSPEQLFGARDVDERSDLWSLGVVAYEALTGVPAFDGKTPVEIAVRVQQPARPPTSVVPSLPHAIDAWFARACAPERSQRFSSASELADALAAALGAERPTFEAHTPPADAFPLVVHAMATQPTLMSAQLDSTRPHISHRPRFYSTMQDDDGHVSYTELAVAGLPRSPRWPLWIAAAALIAVATGATWLSARGVAAPAAEERTAATTAAIAPTACVAATTEGPIVASPTPSQSAALQPAVTVATSAPKWHPHPAVHHPPPHDDATTSAPKTTSAEDSSSPEGPAPIDSAAAPTVAASASSEEIKLAPTPMPSSAPSPAASAPVDDDNPYE